MFIYVMNKDARDELLSLGYNLIRSADEIGVWVFENQCPENFSQQHNFAYVVSDVLTF